jgi:hypothetical protein
VILIRLTRFNKIKKIKTSLRAVLTLNHGNPNNLVKIAVQTVFNNYTLTFHFFKGAGRMKNLVRMAMLSAVVLTIIGTSAVFAQQPTLDKLTFTRANNSTGPYKVNAPNTNISGAVVIPDTYNDAPVATIGNFMNCAGITSVIIPNSVTLIDINAFNGTGISKVTIPASVDKISTAAFANCSNLTSVTFEGRVQSFGSANAFPGDLVAKHNAGGAGTYTRSAGSNTWTKQGGYTLSGTYTRSDGTQITITESGQTVTITGNYPNNGGRINETLRR